MSFNVFWTFLKMSITTNCNGLLGKNSAKQHRPPSACLLLAHWKRYKRHLPYVAIIITSVLSRTYVFSRGVSPMSNNASNVTDVAVYTYEICFHRPIDAAERTRNSFLSWVNVDRANTTVRDTWQQYKSLPARIWNSSGDWAIIVFRFCESRNSIYFWLAHAFFVIQ